MQYISKNESLGFSFFSIEKAAKKFNIDMNSVPISIKIFIENVLRNFPNDEESVKNLLNWQNTAGLKEINYKPSRVLMQDFTGVPAIVDLASMRDAVKNNNQDPSVVNPKVDVHLIIDHSVQVDSYKTQDSIKTNVKKEMERNIERYEFLRWGQNAFKNLYIIPPNKGICHQINIEHLANIVSKDSKESNEVVYPDTLVGTDSHTTMVNALCTFGWGVGGIEAESVMLGRSIAMLIPHIVGFKLNNKLQQGVTSTDLVLTITKILREKKVVQKFVEFYGDGLNSLSLEDRATIANMAPECGCTVSMFPVDNETIKYLYNTGRDEKAIKLAEEYAKSQGLWSSNSIDYKEKIELDLSSIEPVVAGPKRPQDMIFLRDVAESLGDHKFNRNELHDGAIVIGAITSCTNTSNPNVMIAAGILAKKAVEKGLSTKPWVKTSIAPGSQVVTNYLEKSGLLYYLNKLGFNIVAYGCTTCIGNSGPLNDEVEQFLKSQPVRLASVLSGNRNFEGRVHPNVKLNYLASPPLVVAYSIAGSAMINLERDPIGTDPEGKNVYLKDIWPSNDEIANIRNQNVTRESFIEKYSKINHGGKDWDSLAPKNSTLTYPWRDSSSYIRKAPYFDMVNNVQYSPYKNFSLQNARILAILGDSVTTDHISPAGSIPVHTPAAKYLQNLGIDKLEFNSYGSRRGNHEVMTRGTFANIRIQNTMTPHIEGGYTIHYPSKAELSIYDAAQRYITEKIPLVVFAGKDYGMGSSRDWAAKGTMLLGVKAVIAESFERIHQSNLIGMGVLPLVYKDNPPTLLGDEIISLESEELKPKAEFKCHVQQANGDKISIPLECCINTEIELDYIINNGLLNSVVKDFMKE